MGWVCLLCYDHFFSGIRLVFYLFPQAMLGGFSFRAGEHTTSAVRKIAGPNQNDYNFRKNRTGNVPEKPARKTCPGPLGPGPKGSPGARVQGGICSFGGENKVVVQSQKFAILVEFSLNLSPVMCPCNEIRYPRGF